MNSNALFFGRPRLRHGLIRTSPPLGQPARSDRSDHGLAALGRDIGLRTPDSISTPEMAEQTGISISVLRWVPAYVIGLVIILLGGIGLLVVAVL